MNEQMNLRHLAPLAFAALFLWGIADIHAAAAVDPRPKEFAAQKRRQMEELADKLHLDVPAEARNFFKAAKRPVIALPSPTRTHNSSSLPARQKGAT